MRFEFIARTFAIASLVTIGLPSGAATELVRRAQLGVVFGAEKGELVVLRVAPGGNGERSGILPGDVILQVENMPARPDAEFVQLVRSRKAGDKLAVALRRNGKEERVLVEYAAPPVEHPAGFEVRYDAVKVDGYSRRTLITIPRPNGRFPAVLWVAGSGCGSQEDPSGGAPTVELLYELTRRGFVTMRVEKSGTGDSEGPPCYSDSGGVAQEVRDYTAALGALRSFPFVDANRVYLFGHSVGATLAPMVAKGQKIQGIVVAGGMGTNFVSYMRAMFQKDLELAGRSTDEIQPTMKVVGRCTSRLFLDRQPPGSVESSMPDCKRYVHYDSPPPYLQDLADANLGKIWEDAPPVPVLVLYGSGDFVTNLAESEALKGTINRAHPATAILKVLAMDHEFRQAESQQDAWRSEQGQIPPRPLLSDAVDEVQRFLSRAP